MIILFMSLQLFQLQAVLGGKADIIMLIENQEPNAKFAKDNRGRIPEALAP